MAAEAGSPYKPPCAMLDQGFGVQGVLQLPTGMWGRFRRQPPSTRGTSGLGKAMEGVGMRPHHHTSPLAGREAPKAGRTVGARHPSGD